MGPRRSNTRSQNQQPTRAAAVNRCKIFRAAALEAADKSGVGFGGGFDLKFTCPERSDLIGPYKLPVLGSLLLAPLGTLRPNSAIIFSIAPMAPTTSAQLRQTGSETRVWDMKFRSGYRTPGAAVPISIQGGGKCLC